MNWRKRLLALLMSLAMVLTYMPTIAFAEGEAPDAGSTPALEETQAGSGTESNGTAQAAEQDKPTAGEPSAVNGAANADETSGASAGNGAGTDANRGAGTDEGTASGDAGDSADTSADTLDAIDPAALNDAGDPEVTGAPDGELTEDGALAVDPEADPQQPDPAILNLTVPGRIERATANVDLADNDELLMEYLQKGMTGKTRSGMLKAAVNTRGSKLKGNNRAVYDLLRPEIAKIASGERTDATIVLPLRDINPDDYKDAYTAADLGVDSIIVDGEFNNDAVDAVYGMYSVDFEMVLSALLADMPYEFYWFDKTAGCFNSWSSIGASWNGTEYTISFADPAVMTFYFSIAVAEEYRGEQVDTFDDGAGGVFPMYSVAKTDTIDTAIDTANQIVEDCQEETDYNKLVEYKDAICRMVSYNRDAAQNDDTPYGNPWQLIWVFDNDPDTNVVCEGYSKAFQFLCDNSDFDHSGIECHTVSGKMTGGTGAGDHMWNVVTMENGKNYIADITNCDAGTIGDPDLLFLTGCMPGGNFDDGYDFDFLDTYLSLGKDGVSDIHYGYDYDMSDIYSEEELDLSTTDYVDPDSREVESMRFVRHEPLLLQENVYVFREKTNGYYEYYIPGELLFTQDDPDTPEDEADKLYIKYEGDDTEYEYAYYGYGTPGEQVFARYDGNSWDRIDAGEDGDVEVCSTQEGPWNVGETHNFAIEYRDVFADYPVTIVETPIQSIAFQRYDDAGNAVDVIDLLENVDGFEDEDGEGNTYFSYYIAFNENDRITIVYKDGRTVEYQWVNGEDGDDYFQNTADEDDLLHVDTIEQYANEGTWESGDHVITIRYNGCEYDQNVRVVESGIEGISFERTTLGEGDIIEIWGDEYEDVYFEFIEGDVLTVTYGDVPVRYELEEIEGDDEFISQFRASSIPAGVDAPEVISVDDINVNFYTGDTEVLENGGEYTAEISYLGRKCTFPFRYYKEEITPATHPVSIEFHGQKQLMAIAGQGFIHRSTLYYPGNEFVVTFEDGHGERYICADREITDEYGTYNTVEFFREDPETGELTDERLSISYYVNMDGFQLGTNRICLQTSINNTMLQTDVVEVIGVATEEEITGGGGEHVHELYLVEAQPATCTEPGHIAYYACRGCDNIYLDENGETILNPDYDIYTEALGHDWGDWTVVTEPSATEEGYEERVCGRCGAVEGNSIPATGEHVHQGEWMEGKQATCTEDGFADYYYCEGCGKSFFDAGCTREITEDNEDELVIPATGHSYVYVNYVWADDHSTCTAVTSCYNCGENAEFEGTVTSVVTVEPTDDEEGEIVYTAEFPEGIASTSETAVLPPKGQVVDVILDCQAFQGYLGETDLVDFPAVGDKVTLVLGDGSRLEYVAEANPEGSYRKTDFYRTVDGEQQRLNYNAWSDRNIVEGTNAGHFMVYDPSYMAKDIEVQGITDEAIDSITIHQAETLVLIEGVDQKPNWNDDLIYDHQQGFRDADTLTIDFKDGTSKTYQWQSSYHEFYNVEDRDDIIKVNVYDDQEEHPWTPSDTPYDLKVMYHGIEAQGKLQVKVVTNDVEDAEFYPNRRTVLFAEEIGSKNSDGTWDLNIRARSADNKFFIDGDRFVVTKKNGSTVTYTYNGNLKRFEDADGVSMPSADKIEIKRTDGTYSTVLGENIYAVNYCGYGSSIIFMIEENHQHEFEYNEYVDSDCVTEGHGEYYFCKGCERFYIYSSYYGKYEEVTNLEDLVLPINPNNHTVERETIKEATCAEGGQERCTCTKCGKVWVEDTYPTYQHTWMTVEGKAPTCSEDGYRSYNQCSVCGVIDGQIEVIPKSDNYHSYNWHEVTPASCEEDGAGYYECIYCHDRIDQVITAHGHYTYEDKGFAPDCTTYGIKPHWHCNSCSKDFLDEECTQAVAYADLIIPPIPHTLVHHPGMPVTCTTNGEQEYWQCSVCGWMFADEACTDQISFPETYIAPGHQYSDWQPVDAKTHKMVCSECGETLTGEHAFNSEVTVQPTFDREGVRTYTCIECGYSYTEAIPKSHIEWDEQDHDQMIATATSISRIGYVYEGDDSYGQQREYNITNVTVEDHPKTAGKTAFTVEKLGTNDWELSAHNYGYAIVKVTYKYGTTTYNHSFKVTAVNEMFSVSMSTETGSDTALPFQEIKLIATGEREYLDSHGDVAFMDAAGYLTYKWSVDELAENGEVRYEEGDNSNIAYAKSKVSDGMYLVTVRAYDKNGRMVASDEKWLYAAGEYYDIVCENFDPYLGVGESKVFDFELRHFTEDGYELAPGTELSSVNYDPEEIKVEYVGRADAKLSLRFTKLGENGGSVEIIGRSASETLASKYFTIDNYGGDMYFEHENDFVMYTDEDHVFNINVSNLGDYQSMGYTLNARVGAWRWGDNPGFISYYPSSCYTFDANAAKITLHGPRLKAANAGTIAILIELKKGDYVMKSIRLNGDVEDRPTHTHTPGTPVYENVTKKATTTATGLADKVTYCTECGEEISRETGAVIPKAVAPKTIIRNTVANSAKKTNDVIWDKVAGATSYELRWRASGGSWKSTTVGNTVRGVTTGLTIGGLYEIQVRPIKPATATTEKVIGNWSASVYRYFYTTQKIRLTSKSKGTFTMSWAKDSKATGYQVLFTTNSNGAGAAKNIVPVKASATSVTVSKFLDGKGKFKSGQTIYVQVRELRKVGNITYVGNISCPVAVKIK